MVLTKPLGTGIIATAIKKGKASLNSIELAIRSMATLNKNSAQGLLNYNVNAVTDVTGFGLLGHLKEMCENSGVSSEINFQDLEFLDSAIELAMSGIIPGGTRRNLKSVNEVVVFNKNLSKTEELLSADAQTSGGLLISMPIKDAKSYIKQMDGKPKVIGHITGKKPYIIKVN